MNRRHLLKLIGSSAIASPLGAQAFRGLTQSGYSGGPGDVRTGIYADWDLYNPGGTGTTVTDLSGNGHTLTFASGPNAPSWGPPYLVFSGNQWAQSSLSGLTTQPFTIVSVHKTDPTNTSGVLFDGITSQTTQYLDSTFSRYQTLAGNTLNSAAVVGNGTWETLIIVFNGTSSRVYQNGVGIDWGTTGTNVGGLLRIGSEYGSGGVGYIGVIGTSRVYNRAISDAEALELHTYLAYLYSGRGVTLPIPPTYYPYENQATMGIEKAYVAQKYGFMFVWNMSTYAGTQSLNGLGQWANPNLPVNTFAPTGLDVGSWLDAVVASGGKYAILTTKHHDGFALWPTAQHASGFSPYSVAQTSWYAANGNPDVVAIFVAACRARSLNPILYFSLWDRTWEVRSNQTMATATGAYTAYIQAQLAELLTNYGAITAIWTDGWGWTNNPTATPGDVSGGVGAYSYLPYLTMRGLVSALQPSCVLAENNHHHQRSDSMIELYEVPSIHDGFVPSLNLHPAECADTIRIDETDWFIVPTDDQSSAAIKTAATLGAAIDLANSRNAVYTIGVTPSAAGVLPSAQVTVMGQIPAAL